MPEIDSGHEPIITFELENSKAISAHVSRTAKGCPETHNIKGYRATATTIERAANRKPNPSVKPGDEIVRQ
jgi:hypothetical protein